MVSGIRFATAPTCDSTRAAQTQRARAQSVKAILTQSERHAHKLLASDTDHVQLKSRHRFFWSLGCLWWCKRGLKARSAKSSALKNGFMEEKRNARRSDAKGQITSNALR